jgi:hypothetical protein
MVRGNVELDLPRGVELSGYERCGDGRRRRIEKVERLRPRWPAFRPCRLFHGSHRA